ncbi:hypothetical protein RchiOBHm_Chr1g0363951 [Rosa chinensis]|uniref:Uncharacterized protein n=1 Tax=Rosa chinensis TaxID=74649 RepID=A0A2P6SJL8_ROSCH|nr:hypothetical protein RchiOBHm_Chr1g0363951 [Rosa chinensis]
MADSNNKDLYDADDTLSFCDFSVYNDDYDNNYSTPRKYPESPDQDMFEFLIDPDFELDSTAMDTIVFCGKTMNNTTTKQPKLFTRDPHNGLFLVKTNSFKRSQSLRSVDLATKPSFKSSPATASCRYQSVKSRKHKMVLIGSLSKPQPKMVLSDIKKRQGRLAPAPLFPVSEGGEQTVDGGSKAHKLSLLRPLRCRAHFVSALVKASFGCISSPRPVNGHAALT